MTSHDARERARRQALEVAATLSHRQAPEPGTPPRVGELYLCRRTAAFPVEWLVIEADAGRLRLVPVDDYPLVGSCDVELTTTSLGGVAVARCAYGDWIDGQVLDAELRTGVVGADDLDRARAKRRAIESGESQPTLLEDVADGDPEYQRWCEGTLASAVEALTTSEASAEPIWIRSLKRHWRPILAMAALLVAALGLGAYAVRLDNELATTRERLAMLEQDLPEQEALLAEQARLREASEAEASRLSELLGAAEAALTDARSEIGDLGATVSQMREALDAGITANVKKLVFGKDQRTPRGAGTTRGTALIVQAGSSERLFLEVEVVDPEPYLTYDVRLVSKAGEVIAVDGLDRDGAWLRFSLPAHRLDVGDYQVLITGSGFGEENELEERYRLVVEP